MQLIQFLSVLAIAFPTISLACTPLPGSTPLNADQLLAKAPFAFIATAQEASAQLSKTTIQMKVDCVIKGNANAQNILNAAYVTVGPFQGTSMCGVNAAASERMMIFVDKVTAQNGTYHLELRGDAYPHSQKRPVPQQVSGQGLVLKGGKCPALKGGCSAKTVTVTKTLIIRPTWMNQVNF